MAHFLRDTFVKNVTIDDKIVTQLSSLFENRVATFNAAIPEGDGVEKRAIFSYVIRFDGKGYRVYSLDELMRYFQQAKEIERIVFTFETGESLGSSRNSGTVFELKFDQENENGCFLTVTSDDNDWVDASFSAVQDILAKCKNKNGWARTAWTLLLVQIVGVALGFFISLWAAVKISPKVSIQNSFVFCFLFVLLVFSNTWSYLNKLILALLNNYFPNVMFYRPNKDRVDWLMQAVIGGVVVAVMLWMLSMVFSYVGTVLGGFVTKAP